MKQLFSKSIRTSFLLAFVHALAPLFAAQCDLSRINLPTKTSSPYEQVVPGFKLLFTPPDECCGGPLVVKDLKTKTECTIQNLEADETFLTEDKKILVVPGSGYSNSWIRFYELSTCKLIKDVHGTGVRPWIVKNKVNYPGECETSSGEIAVNCSPAGVIQLSGPVCAPSEIDDQSKALTEIIYGVSFSKGVDIQNVGAKNARIVKERK